MSLASLNDLKKYLQMPDVVSADAELTRLLGMADACIELELNRTLSSGTRTERRSGYGTDILSLRDYPVTAVSLLKINGVEIAASVDGSAGYYFERESIYLLGGMCFTRGRKNILINYTAGYTTIPADIQHAAIEIAAQAFREREWIGQTSKSLAGETTAFARGFMPDSAKETLSKYRRRYACD